MRKHAAIICLAMVLIYSGNLFADNSGQGIGIAALYGGVITNKCSYKGSEFSGSGGMGGLYLQWVDPSMFQANLFTYMAPDVNYSKVIGTHVNADGFFLRNDTLCFVAGIDVENINIDMDAGSNITGLDYFSIKHNVLFGMARAGVRMTTRPSEGATLSVFPYAGITRESITGDVVVDPTGPAPITKTEISETDYYMSWGLNAVYRFHFAELTGKYLLRAKKGDHMNSITGRLNLFVHKHVLLSYQYKYIQLENGSDSYHLLGAGVVF